jgi:hypothetical protein
MPNLDEENPSSPYNRPLLVCRKVPTKNNSKGNFNTSAGIFTSGEMVPSVGAGNSQNPAATSKSLQAEDISVRSNIGIVSYDNAVTDQDESYSVSKRSSMLPGKSASENSHSKSGSENMESQRAYNGILDSRGNKVSPAVRNTTPKVRQGMNLVSNKEVTDCSTTLNLHVNFSLPTIRAKSNTCWQVTDLLLHSSSVASEKSSGSNTVAKSTTDWAVSDVKQKFNHTSTNANKPDALNLSCSDSGIYTRVNEEKLSSDKPDVNINTRWKSYMDIVLPKPVSEQHLVNGDSLTTKYEIKSVQGKKRKYLDDATSSEDTQSSQRKKNKNVRDSSIEECTSKHYNKKQEKKLKKLKKHKK